MNKNTVLTAILAATIPGVVTAAESGQAAAQTGAERPDKVEHQVMPRTAVIRRDDGTVTHIERVEDGIVVSDVQGGEVRVVEVIGTTGQEEEFQAAVEAHIKVHDPEPEKQLTLSGNAGGLRPQPEPEPGAESVPDQPAPAPAPPAPPAPPEPQGGAAQGDHDLSGAIDRMGQDIRDRSHVDHDRIEAIDRARRGG